MLGGLSEQLHRRGRRARDEQPEQAGNRDSGESDREQDLRKVMQRALQVGQRLDGDDGAAVARGGDVYAYRGAPDLAVAEVRLRLAACDGQIMRDDV